MLPQNKINKYNETLKQSIKVAEIFQNYRASRLVESHQHVAAANQRADQADTSLASCYR